MKHHYLACDLGAESGRLMLGTLTDNRLETQELHRFPNPPTHSGQSLTWNLQGLYQGLLEGLAKAARLQVPVTSISTDSWGVDYVLVGADGAFLTPTYHYRDTRCQAGVESAHSRVSSERIFRETGIQFMPFNTLYQLMAEDPGRLDLTRSLLGIGDAFNYLLSGVGKAEVSFASTTQLYNPLRQAWSQDLIHALKLPPSLFPEIVPSGTLLGPLQTGVTRTTGLPPIDVIATCSHDTGAAVAAVPAHRQRWAYLSSGTWSLMGVELDRPVLTDACREFNFTNEIGYGNSVRLLKNIVGLWIIQECRRHWENQGQAYDYATLTQLAAQAPPFAALVRPDDPRFLSPGDMPDKIASFCRETGQNIPKTPGMLIRTVLESLALLYRQNLRQIEQLTNTPIEILHIVGGGSKNQLLNQFTADATGIPVAAGPAEATAIGNFLIQAMASGHVASLAEARQIVSDSSQVATYLPQDSASWAAAWKRFRSL